MTREEILNTPEIVDFMIDKSVMVESKMKLHKRLDELCKLAIKALEQEQKTGRCKNCKYFEYDSVAKVGGIPLIVAHEICNKWGDGCKTSEEGFCFLFEPQESEE